MATTGLLSGGGPLFGGTASDIGILGYTPTTPATTVARGSVDIPLEMAMHEGANKYENYVRAWPDLLHHYLNQIPTDTRSMADWGREHWQTHGSKETDAYMAAQGKTPMEAWRARGMWGDTPLPRTHLGPGRFQASRHLPSMVTDYDPRAGVTQTTYSAGLPQPDVEGYTYEYPVYSWGGNEDPTYSYVGHTTADISEYPYYPYEPLGAPLRSRNDRVLIGQRLVKKNLASQSSSSSSYTPNYATDNSNNGGRRYITNFPSTGNTYEDYVTRSPDLDAAYTNYLNTQDSSVVDFWEEPGVRHGVGGMSGWAGGPMSKAQFGHAHWLNNGKTEGRIF